MTPRKPASAPPKGPSTDLASLSQNDVTILAETFRLLGDPSRLKVMLCCMKGSTSVSDIAEAVELSQSLKRWGWPAMTATLQWQAARQVSNLKLFAYRADTAYGGVRWAW